jgi:hypothetical protein
MYLLLELPSPTLASETHNSLGALGVALIQILARGKGDTTPNLWRCHCCSSASTFRVPAARVSQRLGTGLLP